MNNSLLDQLVEALCCLPGVGPKTAQRMVLHLLLRNRDGGRHLGETLAAAMDGITHCEQCRNLTEQKLCAICANPARDASLVCIVESPADVLAIEQTGHYRGHYFVLMGNLSPIDGIGPAEIGIDRLLQRLADGIDEVIMALGTSVEGEATTHYISTAVKAQGIRVTRIAQGIPLGGELEFIDGGTLSHALNGRQQL
ncbi:MAG: recombination mediator RecR [Pseudomonadota bacterium]